MRRHHGRMYPLQPATEKLNTALRSRNADFFFMDLPRSSNRLPPKDHKPLRRTLTGGHEVSVWETNENMCFALWQLMARG